MFDNNAIKNVFGFVFCIFLLMIVVILCGILKIHSLQKINEAYRNDPIVKTFQVYELTPKNGEWIAVKDEEGLYQIVTVESYTSFGYDSTQEGNGMSKMDFINLKLSRRSEK